MQSKISTALVAEFIGTFGLIFIGAGAAALDTGLVAVALAHGFVVVGFIYSYGHLSGTHINPAVTVSLWAAKTIETPKALMYIAVQLLGGICGAFALAHALGGAPNELGATLLADGVTPLRGLMVEALLTFFLVSAVLHAAVSGKAGSQAGLAVGCTLIACIFAGAPVTGASLNPARTLGPAMVTGNFSEIWLYFVGPILGGVVAALLYRGVGGD